MNVRPETPPLCAREQLTHIFIASRDLNGKAGLKDTVYLINVIYWCGHSKRSLCAKRCHMRGLLASAYGLCYGSNKHRLHFSKSQGTERDSTYRSRELLTLARDFKMNHLRTNLL